MDNKYLPSKQFVARIIIIAIIALIGFGIYGISKYFKNHPTKKALTPLVIKDIVEKDSNVNGIPDWEESLWGLDPMKDGPSNKEFIEAKRATLAAQNGSATSGDANTPISGNDALSREFFAVIMSLQQTGNLDENSLQAVSDAIGKKIVVEPIADTYKKNMVTVEDNDDKSLNEYSDSLRKIFIKYKDKNIGDELSFIATALKDNDEGALRAVGTIASAYRSFGKELVKIPVPSDMLSAHLNLANDYENVALSIESLTKLLSEPISGMKGIVNYKKYSEELVTDIESLSDNL